MRKQDWGSLFLCSDDSEKVDSFGSGFFKLRRRRCENNSKIKQTNETNQVAIAVKSNVLQDYKKWHSLYVRAAQSFQQGLVTVIEGQKNRWAKQLQLIHELVSAIG